VVPTVIERNPGMVMVVTRGVSAIVANISIQSAVKEYSTTSHKR
jgi:siroheme synthase (precorrin-2 oxidase/ferrochelatase)